MKYYSEEQIRDQFDPFECEAFFKRQNSGSINVRRCRDCSLFEPDGLQPDHSITKGFCHRMSDEYVPFYVDVTSNSFCNEDEI